MSDAKLIPYLDLSSIGLYAIYHNTNELVQHYSADKQKIKITLIYGMAFIQGANQYGGTETDWFMEYGKHMVVVEHTTESIIAALCAKKYLPAVAYTRSKKIESLFNS